MPLSSEFFAAVRKSLFGGRISQKAVDGLNQIASAWEVYGDGDKRKLAYILASAFHESDRFKTMEEYASGAAYEGRADLGNTEKGDGKRFKGRGFVQITGRRNYADWSKRFGPYLPVDLIANPALAAQPDIAARILVDGMMLGTFTTKKLSDYINTHGMDFKEARRVVNGTDKAAVIANHATKFFEALAHEPAAAIPMTVRRELGLASATPSTPNVVVDAAVQAAMAAVTTQAAEDSNALSSKAVEEARPELVAAMTKAVAASPEVQHASNTEPWWTKRSRWSAIIGPASMIIGIGLKLSGVSYSFGLAEQGLLADGLTAFGTLIAGYLALRAGIATRPLGSGPAPERYPLNRG